MESKMESCLFHTQSPLAQIAGNSSLTFHHIGVATKNIESEMPFFNALGFVYEAEFSDEKQGVRGVFLTPKAYSNTTLPICRFELLENLPNSKRLDNYLKNHHKLYHIAFASENLQADVDFILNSTFSVDSTFKHSNGGGGKMKENSNIMKNENKKQNIKARLVVPIMESTFFAKLCFIMLPNRLLLELVELKSSQQME